VRPAAIDACVACDAAGSVEMLSQIMASAKQAMALRQKAAQALGLISNEAASHALLQQLAYAPAQLEGDVAAGLANNAQAAGLLLDAIEAGKGSAQVLRNAQVAQRLRQIRNDALQARIAKLTERMPVVDERMGNLIASRIAGFSRAKVDISAGKQVFTKTCAACHKIGGEGQKIGPELDGIGNRGAERVIEDVLDPNRNVDQAFRTTLITTDEGQSLNGLALREEGKILVLADNQGKEVRVPLDKVLERTVSPLSPMPANLAEQLSEQDFYQLVAFLLAHDQNHSASEPASKAN